MKINIEFDAEIPNTANMPSSKQIMEWLRHKLNSGENNPQLKMSNNPLNDIELSALKKSISFNVAPQSDDKYEENFMSARKLLGEAYGGQISKWGITSKLDGDFRMSVLGEGGLGEFIEKYGLIPGKKLIFFVHGFRTLIDNNTVYVAAQEPTIPFHITDHHKETMDLLNKVYGDTKGWAITNTEGKLTGWQKFKLESADPETGLRNFKETVGAGKKHIFIAGEDRPLIDEDGAITYTFHSTLN